MPSTRRLAAVLAADVAGYSRLMGEDEEGTLAALKAIRRELYDPKIKEHYGRIVKTTGDGVLVEFASVVDAVRCAVDIQREMGLRHAATPDAKRIELRIGINLGDIIIDGRDIYGDGVNVAARLEALAEPGGICVSRVVRDQVRDKLAFAFEDMGEQQVKNIARPVRVHRVRLFEEEGFPTVRQSYQATAPLAVPDKPSVAVLPFTNMSGDPEQEFVSDGIAEDVITALSRYPSLFVIARNSCFTYKGRAVDAIAQDLFRQSIDLDPTFAGSYSALALVQLQSAAIYQKLDPVEAQSSAEALARQAVALDGADAGARSCLGWALQARGELEGALSEIERALGMSPNLAVAHGQRGATLIFAGRPKQGLAAVQTSIWLDPRDPFSAIRLLHIACGLYFSREYEETIEAAKQLIRSYPDFPMIYRWPAAALGQLGRMAEAKEALDKAVSLAPAAFDMYVRKRVPWFRPEDHAHLVEGLRKAGWEG